MARNSERKCLYCPEGEATDFGKRGMDQPCQRRRPALSRRYKKEEKEAKKEWATMIKIIKEEV